MNLIEKHRALVSRKVFDARKFAKLSQEGLAVKAGLSRQQVWRIEGGLHTPTTRTLQKIADACGVGVEFFEVSDEEVVPAPKGDDEEPGPQMTLDDFMRIRARQILHEEREAAELVVSEGVL